MSQATTKVGGAFSLAPVKERVFIGGAVYAVHFRYDVNAAVSETWVGDLFPLGPVKAVESESITFDEWQPGWALAASVRVVPHFAIVARWQVEPQFDSTRTAARRPLAAGTQLGATSSAAAQLQLPEVRAVGVIVTAKNTVFATELSRVSFGNAFQPTSADCGSVIGIGCLGWGWSETLSGNTGLQPFEDNKLVGTSDAFVLRGGIEQTIPIRAGYLRLRGGAHVEQGHALLEVLPSYVTSTPNGNPGEGFPTRDDVNIWSAGIAYAWKGMELGVGLATGNTKTRIMSDLRFRLP